VRVVFVNQYYAPAEAATAPLLTDLAEHLTRQGHHVVVVCSSRSYPDPGLVYPAAETREGVIVRRAWTTGFGRGSRLGRLADYVVFALGAASILVRERRADVVVSLTTPPMISALAWGVARLHGARSVQWVMDVYPELAFVLGALRRRSLAGRLLDRISRKSLEGSDLLLALGETMAERLRAAGAERVEVVHNWADGELIRPSPTAGNRLRAAWGWGERLVVLYSGNLGLAHEFETVLDAAEQLRGEPEVLFAFVGSGPRREAVAAEVARRGLPNVEFRPHVAREELGLCLAAGDVHLVTMREGIAGLVVPSKIYGILAAGRPALFVGPAACEAGEILAAGGCGRRLDVGDAAGLAAEILAYRAAPARRIEEGERARRLFDERFAAHHALARHTALLVELAREPGP